MSRLHYSYHMQLSFESPVKEHYFKLRCFPSSDERQKISGEHIKIFPAHFSNSERDSFGNMCIYGTALQTHSRFSVDVSGTAEINALFNVKADTNRIHVFKYETKLTTAGANIRAFHRTFPPLSYMTFYERAVFMMERLFEEFYYMPGKTGVFTTAEEAFSMGHGVCQDYAQILLTLCRIDRIPCRYVTGMIPGEGATHAWTEIYSPESSEWIAIDPTHNRKCDGTYIKISSGRDSQDCAINQGVFTGGGRQSQEIKVIVAEAF